MSDSPTLPLTGSGDSTVKVSTEEVTTLNGGAVSAEHIQRVVPAARTADGTAVDIGHAEDAAHASGHAGIMALAVRKDTAAALAGTDGDYAPLEVDADGKLHVQTGTVTVSNAHLTSLGGAISGTEVQVDVVGALPAGTNAIGKLAANSGVDIGDVDVTSVVPGTGASNLGKAEDAAHSTGDVGVMSLAVRKDTAAALAGTDGDYAPLEVDADGKLHVNPGTVTVTNAHLTSLGGAISGTEVQVDVVGALPAGTNAIGKLAANSGVDIGDVDVTSVVPGTGASNLGKAEDAAHTTGDVGVMGLAVRTDTPANRSGTDGDYEPLQMSAGRLWTSATVDAALPAGTNAIGKLAANSGVDIGDVDVTSVVPGSGATNLGKAEDAVHASGDVGVMALAVRADTPAATGADGDYVPLLTDASGRLHVSASQVAHDAADSGNPVKVGAQARTTNPTAVADSDRVNIIADDIGRQVIVPHGVRDLVGHQHTQIASSASETTIITAGAGGVFNDLICLILTNQTATAVNVTIKDATAGTTRMIIALAASGGAVIPFPAPVKQAAAANNWTATLSSAAVTVNIFAQYVANV